MHIVIPMAGKGKRFSSAGYTTYKPLIEVDGKPVIEHVISMFPGENKFTFICNEEHLASTALRSILLSLVPEARIAGIPYMKKGPVYTVSRVFELIDDNEEVIVNYCDFGKRWNYRAFLEDARSNRADGAISAYRGFHPHMLKNPDYAFIREKDMWLLEISEKRPFTSCRMKEYASDGTYYFRSGAILKKYFTRLMERNIEVEGEYYVSLVYNLMLEDGLKTRIFEIENMLQWGTPEDLEEYLAYSSIFRKLSDTTTLPASESSIPLAGPSSDRQTVNIMPLAGKGTRFIEKGYKTPKPLLDVSGKPMVIQAASCLPPATSWFFITLNRHLDETPLENYLKNFAPDSKIIKTPPTAGQAESVALALERLEHDRPVLIGSCDCGVLWNRPRYLALLGDETIDVIVWTFRRHPNMRRKPEIYSWVEADRNGFAKRISVKRPLTADPFENHAFTGIFFFRRAGDFLRGLSTAREQGILINGEFYADTVVEILLSQGSRIAVFEVDNYLGWGTPEELETFLYWQRCFHHLEWHPYSLEKDPFVRKENIPDILARKPFYDSSLYE